MTEILTPAESRIRHLISAGLRRLADQTDIRAAAVTIFDCRTGETELVSSFGYKAHLCSVLISRNFMDSEGIVQQSTKPRQLLSWEQVDFRRSHFAEEFFQPHGYNNGLSVPLLGARARKVTGFLHVSTAGRALDDETREIATAAQSYMEILISRVHQSRRAVLSAREREIVQLIAEGLSNVEIANELFVSRRTVATHLENIFRKTGIRNRVSLAVWSTRIAHQHAFEFFAGIDFSTQSHFHSLDSDSDAGERFSTGP